MYRRESRHTLAVSLTGLLATTVAATSTPAKDELVPLAEVPAVAMEAALRAVPGLVVEEAERESGALIPG